MPLASPMPSADLPTFSAGIQHREPEKLRGAGRTTITPEVLRKAGVIKSKHP